VGEHPPTAGKQPATMGLNSVMTPCSAPIPLEDGWECPRPEWAWITKTRKTRNMSMNRSNNPTCSQDSHHHQPRRVKIIFHAQCVLLPRGRVCQPPWLVRWLVYIVGLAICLCTPSMSLLGGKGVITHGCKNDFLMAVGRFC
jgi:hypothetical protein